MKLNVFYKSLIYIMLFIIIMVFIISCTSKYTTNDRKNLSIYHDNNDVNIFKESKNQSVQQLQSNNIIYFVVNRYNIQPHFFRILNIHANFLCNHPSYHIRIEGHADERGTPEYNIALGERRANSVKLYFQSKGVLSEQISTISYGKEKPMVLGHNETAYSKNRRVVLIYQ